jgi:hypothetical protein
MSSEKWHKMAIKSVGKSEVYRGNLRKIMLDKCRKVWYRGEKMAAARKKNLDRR